MGFAAYSAVGFRVLHEAAVMPFAIHQNEATGVPQFVTKVAIALAALGVKVDVALVAPESTADRTGVNVRQKPQRLLDERQD